MSEAKSSGSSFFAHQGASMNPTLNELDVLEVAPCNDHPIRFGDVVVFRPPGYELTVVHRVIGLIPAGYVTRGDNNDRDDPWPLQPAEVLGRVIAAQRGTARRKVLGGRSGLLLARLVRWRRALDQSISRRLHPLYAALAGANVIPRLAPAPWRPRVVMFQAGAARNLYVLWGSRIIGEYAAEGGGWRIRRPFRLVVDLNRLAAVAGLANDG